jgi:ABC-2 type transport system permease protein
MWLRLIRVELMKLKRSPIWLAFIILPVIPAVLGTLNYSANAEILTEQWYSLWTQHTLFMVYFFLPLLIGIFCSYSIRQEDNNHNWNRVLTLPAPRACIYIAKLCCIAGAILLCQVWSGLLFVAAGKTAGLTAALPIKELVIWCLFGALGGTVMASIQLLVSMLVKSFALPVGVAMAGGVTAIWFLAHDLGHIWPYSLMAYGMNSNSPQELLAQGYVQFVVIAVVYIALFTAVNCLVISRRDM